MNRKTYLVILGYFLILIIIPITFYLFKDPIKANFFKTKVQVQPKLVRETTISQAATENHPKLFYADLEYDPQTGLVTQNALGKTNGDPPPLLPSPPSITLDNLIYKVEVVSDENVLLRSGWGVIPKEIAQTPQKTLSFRITTLYENQAMVRVILPEKGIIWTGRME